MFEDETVDVVCPECGCQNSILVREFEESADVHFVCEDCKVGVRIEASEFRERLKQVREELQELQREASHEEKRRSRRPRKGDFQI